MKETTPEPQTRSFEGGMCNLEVRVESEKSVPPMVTVVVKVLDGLTQAMTRERTPIAQFSMRPEDFAVFVADVAEVNERVQNFARLHKRASSPLHRPDGSAAVPSTAG